MCSIISITIINVCRLRFDHLWLTWISYTIIVVKYENSKDKKRYNNKYITGVMSCISINRLIQLTHSRNSIGGRRRNMYITYELHKYG